MTLMTVPCLDIAPYLTGRAEDKGKIALQVNRAGEDIGFLVIIGHGVDQLLCDRLFAAGKNFFDLPLEEKLRVRGSYVCHHALQQLPAASHDTLTKPPVAPNSLPARAFTGSTVGSAQRCGPTVWAMTGRSTTPRSAGDLL